MYKALNLKSVHIIIANALVWLLFLSVFLFHFPNRSNQELIFLFVIAFIFYYLNSLLFIPKLLSKGKVIKYFLTLLISLIIALAITIVANKYMDIYKPDNRLVTISKIEQAIYSSPGELLNKEELIKKIKKTSDYNRVPIPMRTVIFIMLIFGISTSIKVTQEWLKNEKVIKEAENNQLNAELAFLKSQVNPHFLFNTLNSIYSLANRKSEKAADAIAKLSTILRYMLYNVDHEFVILEDEIQYLNDYVELQKLRLNDNVIVDFKISGKPQNYKIAPMLLLPFVENAFKHGTNTVNKCSIYIDLIINDNDMFFEVENTAFKQSANKEKKNSGIGLQNVKRRLELIYPNNHQLDITKNDRKFNIKLKLSLTGNELLNS